MSEVEKQTNGCWRPSPGSIYPLIAWLQDQSYIKEASGQEAGVKRYTLTEQGRGFYEEQTKTREEMSKRLQYFGPFGPPFGSFSGPMSSDFYPEKAQEFREAIRHLFITMWQLRDVIRMNHSEEATQEAAKALEEAARKIDEITKKLKE